MVPTTDNDELLDYVTNAIQRIEAGELSGSHLAGVFGKAATGFEKEIRLVLSRLLESCGLGYVKDIKGPIKGPAFEKLTLGQCCAALEQATKLQPDCASAFAVGGMQVNDLVARMSGINKAWVKVKHGGEVASSTLVAELESMLTVLQQSRVR